MYQLFICARERSTTQNSTIQFNNYTFFSSVSKYCVIGFTFGCYYAIAIDVHSKMVCLRN